MALFGSTILLTTILWTARNYSLTHKIIPFTQAYSGVPYNPSKLALRNLVATWGGSAEDWNPKAEGSFFYSGTGPGRVSTGTYYNVNQLPVTSYYNRDSLLMLRNYISSVDLSRVDLRTDSSMAKRIDLYTNSYKKQFPVQFYFLSPIRIIMAFTINSGSYYINASINGKTNYLVLLFKLIQSVLYYIFLIGGFTGLLIYFKKLWLYAWVPFFLILFFCYIIKLIELRYFLYAYPSLVLGLMMLFNKLFKNQA